MKHPILVWLLIFLLVFLGLGGIYGGVLMLIDPTGKALQVDNILHLLPVPNFILPGLFLIFVMGIFPLFLVFGLTGKPTWAWGRVVSQWTKYYWAWTGAMGIGIVLILWLAVQTILMGFQWPIQYITLVNGLLIVVVALAPQVRGYYAES